MVLVSGFGEKAEVTGTRFFVMRHKFLLCTHFFCNVPLKYCNALVHYEKTGALQKTDGCIMKKQAHNKKTGTRNLCLFPETRNKNHC